MIKLEMIKKKITYYHMHVAYFVTLALLGTFILWCIGTKDPSRKHFAFVDCIYMVISGLCLSGLGSVPIESVPTSGQVLIMFCMILGGTVFTSIAPLLVKKHRYCKIVRTALRPSNLHESRITRFLRSISTALNMKSKENIWMESMAMKRELSEPFRIVFLEHQAISVMADIVVFYYTLIHVVGFLIAWLSIVYDSKARLLLREKNVNPGFFALFAVISAFANTGFVLANENMVFLNTSSLLLIDLFFMVLLGNTLLPAALRGILWILHRYSRGTRREIYALLLDQPSRYYPHLFSTTATWWLILTAVGFNGLASLVFYVLEWNNATLDGLNTLQKLINGVFQAANTRSGGMNSVNLVSLSPALLFLYCVMMYIKAYPVSLKEEQCKEDDTTYAAQSKRWLFNDNTYLILLVLFICVSLNSQLKNDPRNFNVFNVVFEVASAYGCVGLTVGYTCNFRVHPGACKDKAISFSGMWGVPGKIFIMMVMMIGRHRDLPDHIATDSEKITAVLRRPSFIALTQQLPL